MYTETQLKKLTKADLIKIILTSNLSSNVTSNSTSSVKVIQDFTWNGVTGIKIISINDKKFKINYDNSNGHPLGFNYKFSASVLTENNGWKYVAEAKNIGYKPTRYFSSEEERHRDAIRFVKHMQEYLEKVIA